MNKVYVLLGVLVVLVVVAVRRQLRPERGRGATAPRPSRSPSPPKLPAIDQNRIHAIELSDAENRVRVARSGEKWVLPEKFRRRYCSSRSH